MVFLDFTSTSNKQTYYCELDVKVSKKDVFGGLKAELDKYIPSFQSVHGNKELLANTNAVVIYYCVGGKIKCSVKATFNDDGTVKVENEEWLSHPTSFGWNFDSHRFNASDLVA